jgi:hypothetical protein
MMRFAGAILVLGCSLLVTGGCASRPRAPVLRDDPVYQNDQEGFRFLAPEGWNQSTRADMPRGKWKTEIPLVAYRRRAGPALASFRVSLIDLPTSADLAAHVSAPSYGVDKWTQTGPPEDVTMGSVGGVRYILRGRSGKEDVMKEVVCVRRGERVYFFTSMFPPGNTELRDQLRKVVEGVIWKN